MTTADYLEQLQQDREDLVDNLEAKGITGLTGDETFTELVPEVLNIESGADLSDYFTPTISGDDNSGLLNMIKKIPDNIIVEGTSLRKAFYRYNGTTIPLLDTSNVTDMNSMFASCTNLTTIPSLDTSNVTDTGGMFTGCTNLISIPLIDISNVTSNYASSMFSGCTNLTTVPLLNTSKLTNMNHMFTNCPSLTDISLDNILQMCINSKTTVTARKTLAYIGLTSNNYPTSRIEALPHYQDFINAGWTIGY